MSETQPLGRPYRARLWTWSVSRSSSAHVERRRRRRDACAREWPGRAFWLVAGGLVLLAPEAWAAAAPRLWQAISVTARYLEPLQGFFLVTVVVLIVTAVARAWVRYYSWSTGEFVTPVPSRRRRRPGGDPLTRTRRPRNVSLHRPGERLSADAEKLSASLVRQPTPAAHSGAPWGTLNAFAARLVLSVRLATAREDERRRLRRDLHDGLGPTLAGLTLGLDTAWALSARDGDLQELRQLLSRLKAETQRAVIDMRRIVYGVRPPAVDELGLTGSLREEIARLQHEVPSLTIALYAPDIELTALPAAVEVAAYRVVTEALTNVARHARASSCAIRIRLDRGLTIEVCDDGAGFPEGWRAGVGITAMRERVAELGGDLAIEACHPCGTRIAARLPAAGPP